VRLKPAAHFHAATTQGTDPPARDAASAQGKSRAVAARGWLDVLARSGTWNDAGHLANALQRECPTAPCNRRSDARFGHNLRVRGIAQRACNRNRAVPGKQPARNDTRSAMAIAEPRTCNPSEMSPAINAPARATQQVSLEVFHLLAKDLLHISPFSQISRRISRDSTGVKPRHPDRVR